MLMGFCFLVVCLKYLIVGLKKLPTRYGASLVCEFILAG